METKKLLTTNGSQTKRGGNRNKTGKGGFGDRPEARNTNGQRSAAAVAFSRNLRELIVAHGESDYEMFRDGRSVGKKKNVEWLIERVWLEALKGEAWAVNFIAERTEGKVSQPIDALLKMIDVTKLNDEQLERFCSGEDILSILLSGAGANQGAG